MNARQNQELLAKFLASSHQATSFNSPHKGSKPPNYHQKYQYYNPFAYSDKCTHED